MNLYFSRKFTYSPTYSLCSTDVLSGQSSQRARVPWPGEAKERGLTQLAWLYDSLTDSLVQCS